MRLYLVGSLDKASGQLLGCGLRVFQTDFAPSADPMWPKWQWVALAWADAENLDLATKEMDLLLAKPEWQWIGRFMEPTPNLTLPPGRQWGQWPLRWP